MSEFHRRNEEARLIEARSQEPVVRGVRLLATGLVDQPGELVLEEAPLGEPIGHRRVFTGDAWHDEVPVYDGDALRPGTRWRGLRSCRAGSRRLCSPPATSARMQPNGDVLIEVAPA